MAISRPPATLADITVNGKTVPVIYAPAKTGKQRYNPAIFFVAAIPEGEKE
jgi:hypothetical protein